MVPLSSICIHLRGFPGAGALPSAPPDTPVPSVSVTLDLIAALAFPIDGVSVKAAPVCRTKTPVPVNPAASAVCSALVK